MIFSKKAFTLAEILVAICAFAVMALPMLFSTSNQNKNAYSVTKHLIASQIAATLMDKFMSKSYSDLIKEYNISQTYDSGEIALSSAGADDIIKKIIDSSDEAIKKELNKDLKTFKYKIYCENFKNNNKKRLYVRVKVSYSPLNNKEDNKTSIILEGLKHGNIFE